MLYAGVEQNEFVAVLCRVEREIFEFHRTAVQPHKIALLAEYGSKLVHNAAVHTAVVVLGALSYSCQFEFVYSVAEKLVESESKSTFKRCGRRHAGSERNVSGENRVETSHFAASLLGFAANSENISCPRLRRSIFFLESEFAIFVEVQRKCPHLVSAVESDFSHHTLVDGTREHETAVIVSVFTDEIDSARRCEPLAFSPEESCKFVADCLFVHCLILLVLIICRWVYLYPAKVSNFFNISSGKDASIWADGR